MKGSNHTSKLENVSAYSNKSLEYFIKGEQFYNAGNYQDALINYDLAVQNQFEKHYKDLAKDLFYNRAVSLQTLGYHYDAVEDFDKAIIYLPDNCQLYHFRSISKSAILDLKGQVTDLLKAIELSKQNSKNSEFWNEYARKTGYSSAADKYNEDLFIAQGRLDTELQFEKFIEEATSTEQKSILEERRAKDRLVMLQSVKKKRQFALSSTISVFEKNKEIKNKNTAAPKFENEKLIPYRRGTKWGFCTIDKQLVVDFLYDYALPFKEGLAAVCKKKKWGYIGETGTEIINCKYDGASSFNEGLALVTANHKRGFIDKSGNVKIPFKYCGGVFFKNGLIGIRKANLIHYLLLIFEFISENTYFNWEADEWNKYGYIDKSGKEAIPFVYNSVGEFNEGLAPVKIGSQYGYINESGKQVIPFKFHKASSFSEGLAAVKAFNELNSSKPSTMYIDKTGNVKLSCDYNNIYPFSEELAKVESSSVIGKCGYINKDGKEVIECKYNHANSFSEGLAVVATGNLYLKYGYIDRNDNIVIPIKYEYASDFHNGLAIVMHSGKWGYINKKGIEYWED